MRKCTSCIGELKRSSIEGEGGVQLVGTVFVFIVILTGINGIQQFLICGESVIKLYGLSPTELNNTFATDQELLDAIDDSESDDEDKDSSNELNTSLSLDGTTLKLSDAGGTLSQELNDTFATDEELTASDNADLDKDDTNELINQAQLNGTAVEITDAGGTKTVELNNTFTTDQELLDAIDASEYDDEDKDSSNELNTSLSLDGTTLKLSDAGGTLSQELNDAFATDEELTASGQCRPG